jgi:regulator of replication initiation timing
MSIAKPIEACNNIIKLQELINERDSLRAENAELRENMEQSTTLSPSQVCAKFHVQACFSCDRADCGDNTTPSIIALRAELAEAKAVVEQMIKNYKNGVYP